VVEAFEALLERALDWDGGIDDGVSTFQSALPSFMLVSYDAVFAVGRRDSKRASKRLLLLATLAFSAASALDRDSVAGSKNVREGDGDPRLLPLGLPFFFPAEGLLFILDHLLLLAARALHFSSTEGLMLPYASRHILSTRP